MKINCVFCFLLVAELVISVSSACSCTSSISDGTKIAEIKGKDTNTFYENRKKDVLQEMNRMSREVKKLIDNYKDMTLRNCSVIERKKLPKNESRIFEQLVKLTIYINTTLDLTIKLNLTKMLCLYELMMVEHLRRNVPCPVEVQQKNSQLTDNSKKNDEVIMTLCEVQSLIVEERRHLKRRTTKRPPTITDHSIGAKKPRKSKNGKRPGKKGKNDQRTRV